MADLMDIPEARAFILHWGEMGSAWGVNRSVAQIHALLYLSDGPLHAEEITEVLGLARSNVSTGLKELQSYGIVRRVHIEGDRRDHFVAETDLWEVLMRLAEERKKRELDPTIRLLGELSDSIKARGEVPPDPVPKTGLTVSPLFHVTACSRHIFSTKVMIDRCYHLLNNRAFI